ncbi:MAG: hypothetical protein DME05_18275 [Candidatus Rokuibacteriota bacterium]|nr:MAG: hypothetical protein DME05_18275 [Candidatus Rokubacteria bacterium]
MLREIRIRNFAVIDSVSASFGPGLNVLTGETGAGKSMLIDAILLVRGARAQADVIRGDSETATVEALFEVEPGSSAAAVLHDAGLALDEGQLVLRRELARSGRHRAFVNDSPVTVGLLERLGEARAPALARARPPARAPRPLRRRRGAPGPRGRSVRQVPGGSSRGGAHASDRARPSPA